MGVIELIFIIIAGLCIIIPFSVIAYHESKEK